jgi:acetate kinase
MPEFRGCERYASVRKATLVVNSGSSSLKFALFAEGPPPIRLWSGVAERIGLDDSRIYAVDCSGNEVLMHNGRVANHEVALGLVMREIENHPSGASLAAVGHRVVHGGRRCDCSAIVTDELETELRRLIPLAPLHQPHNLSGISAVRAQRPTLPQVVCFDTAFHQNTHPLAKITSLPRQYFAQGVQRYAFHGLSYEFIVDSLRCDGVDVDVERIIVAHLGNGASMCALSGGRSLDTTMGFSTLAGLPMGTRCGDLDPGILLYLMSEHSLTVPDIEHLLYEQCGLLGLSGISRNMQDLLDRPDDANAVEAIEAYCYQARRHLGALTAVLGGIDRLVFTAGIGANAAQVRGKICEGLGYLGIILDQQRNIAGERTISSADSEVVVQAFPTDEEMTIARHVHGLLGASTIG